jgi:hypothetical protein
MNIQQLEDASPIVKSHRIRAVLTALAGRFNDGSSKSVNQILKETNISHATAFSHIMCVRCLTRANECQRNTMSIDRRGKEEMHSSSEGILLENSSSAMTRKETVSLSKVRLMENVQQH